jgi:condensation domain-containing protein
VNPGHRYPLTPGQRWIASGGRDSQTAAPIQRLYRLSGDLDTRRLLAALHHVLADNDALRLRLHGSQGRWEQSFPDRELEIDAVAPKGGSAAERRDWALAYLAEATTSALDLEDAGPFSVRLVRLDRDEHLLALTVDHLAVDAVGFDLLEDRLHAAYSGELRPSSADHFRAYLANTHISEAESSRALNYWLDLLLRLPDNPTSDGRVRGKRATLTWKGRPLSECLQTCRRVRWSPFMALLAAEALLLAQYSQRNDVVLNTPFSNRVTDQERSLLANLAILVYLPIQLLPEESVEQFRNRLRRLVIVSMAHRNHDPWELSVELARAAAAKLETLRLVTGCSLVKSPVASRLGERLSLEGLLPFSLRTGTFVVTCEDTDQRFELELLWDPETWPLTDGSELFSAFQLITRSDGSRLMGDLLATPPRPHR